MTAQKQVVPVRQSARSKDYSPPEFVPRGATWPQSRWLRLVLAFTLVEVFWVTFRCETFSGTIARLDRRDLPKAWKDAEKRFGMAMGHGVSTRHALVWLEEEGDMLIGYAFSYMLHDGKVGDRVKIWVRPDTGRIRWIRNFTRRRRWWQY